jgi:hypothetical protein
MQIKYNGYTFTKHPKQKYFYATVKGKKESLHRKTWSDINGIIPKGYHIHHKDGNQFNNDISNLEPIEAFKHISEHAKESFKSNPERFYKLAEIGREYAKEWHRSIIGIEWHKQNAKNTSFGKFDYGMDKCEYCESEYQRKTKSTRFCSCKCKSAWRRKNKPDRKMVNCQTCKIEFETHKYLPNKYCSKECKPAPNPKGYHSRENGLHRETTGI